MSYDWSRFEITFFYYAPMEKVFRSWATPGGLESFFIKRCETPRAKDDVFEAGDPYHFYYVQPYDHDGKILDVVDNERLAFTFGSMEVEVRFEAIDGGAKHRDVARQIDHRAIDQFDRGGIELYDVPGRLHRLAKRREMANTQYLVRRDRLQL